MLKWSEVTINSKTITVKRNKGIGKKYKAQERMDLSNGVFATGDTIQEAKQNYVERKHQFIQESSKMLQVHKVTVSFNIKTEIAGVECCQSSQRKLWDILQPELTNALEVPVELVSVSLGIKPDHYSEKDWQDLLRDATFI